MRQSFCWFKIIIIIIIIGIKCVKIIFNCKKNIRKETNIIVVEVYGENILAHNVA